MARTCSINRREPQPAVVIRATIPRPDIGAGIRALLSEVAGWVTPHGVEIAGARHSCASSMSATEADIEVGIPVASPATRDSRVSTVQLPGGEAAVIACYGPYEGVGTAHSELRACGSRRTGPHPLQLALGVLRHRPRPRNPTPRAG